MKDLLLAVHLVLAVFAIGPLVHAVTTAGRGVRKGDGEAVAASARTLKLYSYVSVLVVVAGIGLMSQKGYGGKEHLGEFGETWIWLSLALWLAAVAIVLILIVPELDDISSAIRRTESVVSRTAKVAGFGGVVALLFVLIIFLMAYKPGS